MSTLELFERMAHLSERMLVAARANDWDLLGALERESASIRDTLITAERNGQAPHPHSETQKMRKAELISRIVAHNAEIRTHTDPWMESVRSRLSGVVRDRAVQKAYSTF